MRGNESCRNNRCEFNQKMGSVPEVSPRIVKEYQRVKKLLSFKGSDPLKLNNLRNSFKRSDPLNTLLGVIVKSGVQAAESSGDLVDVCYLDSILEFHSSDDLGQVSESAQSAPVALCTLPELVHHVQHSVSRQAAL